MATIVPSCIMQKQSERALSCIVCQRVPRLVNCGCALRRRAAADRGPHLFAAVGGLLELPSLALRPSTLSVVIRNARDSRSARDEDRGGRHPLPPAARPAASARIRLPSRTLVAPMAGVTDRPFRQLCKRLGAGYAVSEMAASNPRLWDSVKTVAAHRPRRRNRAEGGADRRRRSGHDGRSRPLQRRSRRADHRHQHGLPRQEGLQRRCRLGADGRRSRWRCGSSTPWSRRSTCRSPSRCAPAPTPATAMRCGSRAPPNRPAPR